MVELYSVDFWFKRPKKGVKDLGYGFLTITRFSDPALWESLQKIFKQEMEK